MAYYSYATTLNESNSFKSYSYKLVKRKLVIFKKDKRYEARCRIVSNTARVARFVFQGIPVPLFTKMSRLCAFINKLW